MLDFLAEGFLEMLGLMPGRAILRLFSFGLWDPDDGVSTLIGIFLWLALVAALIAFTTMR
jgi:hypothetical protein